MSKTKSKATYIQENNQLVMLAKQLLKKLRDCNRQLAHETSLKNKFMFQIESSRKEATNVR